MCRSKRAKRMTRRAYMLLAALMLADGESVPRHELASHLFGWPVDPVNLSWTLEAVDRFVGPIVERRYRVGYRLTMLPPDEHLESMLACVPAVKRSAWWQRRACLIPMTA